jgi:hypothetical protein
MTGLAQLFATLGVILQLTGFYLRVNFYRNLDTLNA